MKRKLLKLLGLLVIIMLLPFHSIANNKTKTRSDFTTTTLANGTRELKAKIFTKKGPIFTYLFNEDIQFYLLNDTNEIFLGKTKTNADGIAVLYIEPEYNIITNENNFMRFVFRYDGNDSCRSAEEELEIAPLIIDASLDIEDETKFINIELKDKNGNPVADEEVLISVKRLYSYLPIESDYTNSRGKLSVEFPNDLPGDSTGLLTISIKINESSTYGTVETIKTEKWGIPVDFSEKTHDRSLWSDQSPLWMLIAIYTVLIAAWVHFFIALFFLFKVRKS